MLIGAFDLAMCDLVIGYERAFDGFDICYIALLSFLIFFGCE